MSVRPNAVLVVLDTARADDVLATTPTVMPNVSEIGDGGTTYENAYAAAPWTLPSHGSLFTGTYPSKHGANGNNMYLSDENRTLAEAFSSAGYDTLGVSNNTWITKEFGFDKGFDSFWKGWQYYQSETDLGAIAHELGTKAKMRAAFDHLFEGNPVINAANLCYSQFVQSRTDSGAARTTDRIESWLTGRDRNPFFMFVNYLEPHIQYQPPKEHAERFLPADADYEEALAVRQDPCAYNVGEYQLSEREQKLLRGLYRGELSYVDEAVGRIKDTLEAEGEWENTIMVVLGDHGENIGDHGFLGHQYNIYDTLLHVPLVVHGGAFEGGNRNDELVQLPDLVPTLLDETGIDARTLREQSQACSFHPSSSGRRKYAMSEYLSPQPPVETLDDRFGPLPEYAYDYDRTLRAIRTDEYKLIVGSDGLEQLYHVASDPAERNDRSATEPEQVAELKQTLDEWLESFEHADSDTESEISSSTKARLTDLGYM
jgi:arylsulfatase A-like enzyme